VSPIVVTNKKMRYVSFSYLSSVDVTTHLERTKDLNLMSWD